MLGISSSYWLLRYLVYVIPRVKEHLRLLETKASAIENETLRVQALSSLESKAFHCYGGAVMALLAPKSRQGDIIILITALQTISDYLDNLCDRAEVIDEKAFSTLHRSMMTAVDPGARLEDYYADYPAGKESSYLSFLVSVCQDITATLYSLEAVRPYMQKLISYYSHLQVYKHLEPNRRETLLRSYVENQVENTHDLDWWETAAATGSTLGMFALLAYGADHDFSNAQKVYDSYFPWTCGLHILLDYFIDQEEDQREGDLNFTAYYQDDDRRWTALRAFAVQADGKARMMEPASLHKLVVAGLLAMYLSDPKILFHDNKGSARKLLKERGLGNLILYNICRMVRKREGF